MATTGRLARFLGVDSPAHYKIKEFMMNTMDEQELMEISVLARALGWKDGLLSQFIAMRLVPVVPTQQEMGNKYPGTVDDLPRSIPRRVDIPVITAQDILGVVKTLGLKYRVGTTTASDTLIVEGQGMLNVQQAINWLRTGVARYACEEISGTTYRIALETLLRELGVKYE